MEPQQQMNQFNQVPVSNTAPEQNQPSVQNTKTSQKNKYIIVIIFLAIAATAGLGFGIYEFCQTSQKDEEVKSLQAENSDLKEQEAIQGEFNDEDISRSKYDSFVENFIKDRKSIVVTGYYYHWNGSDNVVWTANAIIDVNGHLTIEDRNDNMSADGEKIFEGDGYIGVYFVRIGNGNVPFFYLISEDGSVSRIHIGETESREIKQLEGYSNIVSITNSGGTQALLIDIDGNTYLDNGI